MNISKKYHKEKASMLPPARAEIVFKNPETPHCTPSLQTKGSQLPDFLHIDKCLSLLNGIILYKYMYFLHLYFFLTWYFCETHAYWI